MSRTNRNQRGEGRTGLVITIAVIAVGVFCAVKFIPVKIAAYEFHDHLREEARYAAVRDDNKTVAKRIMDKAADMDIPLREKDLSIHRTASEIVIKAHYEQPIDFKFKTYVYKFNVEERAPLF